MLGGREGEMERRDEEVRREWEGILPTMKSWIRHWLFVF